MTLALHHAVHIYLRSYYSKYLVQLHFKLGGKRNFETQECTANTEIQVPLGSVLIWDNDVLTGGKKTHFIQVSRHKGNS